jgi:hypothetical protein
MHSRLLLALPWLAAVQAEQVCNVVTKTIAGNTVWVPGPTGVEQGGQHAWLPVGPGEDWSDDGKPGNGSESPGHAGPGDDGQPGEGHHDGPGNGSGPGEDDEQDHGHGGHGKPTSTISTTSTTSSTHGGPSKPTSTGSETHGGPGKPTSVTSTTSKTHSGPDKPTSTTSETQGGPGKPTSTKTSTEKPESSTTTKKHHSWGEWTVGPGGGVLCTATSTEYIAITETGTTTITAEPSTTVSTIFATAIVTEVAKDVTNTFSSTTTILVLETVSEVVTDVSTIVESTVVETTATTSTIAAPALFTPIQAIYNESGRVDPILKRNVTAPSSTKAAHAVHIGDADLPKCTATTTSVTTSTETISLLSTITAPAETITTETTTTFLTTSTIPGTTVSTTLTFTDHATEKTTTTSTLVTSTTSTSTSTLTTGPTPTVYAACQATNILTNYAGQQIEGIGPNPFSLGYGVDATDCCVQCMQLDGGCGAVARGNTGICYFAGVGAGKTTCDGGKSAGFFQTALLTEGFQIMNGGCGRWNFGSM